MNRYTLLESRVAVKVCQLIQLQKNCTTDTNTSEEQALEVCINA